MGKKDERVLGLPDHRWKSKKEIRGIGSTERGERWGYIAHSDLMYVEGRLYRMVDDFDDEDKQP